MQQLASCIVQICDWMASNRLKLSEEKTQLIWLGMRQQLVKVTVDTLILPHVTISLSETSASHSMVNCLCHLNQPVMLPPASTAQGSPEVTDAGSSLDPHPVFDQQPAGLLQWQSGRHHRSADAEAAGSPVCHCLPYCWRQKV